MVKTEKSIVIDTPIEEVFAYTSDPKHLPEYYTGVIEVSDIQRLADGGYVFKGVSKIAGFHTDTTTTDSEFVPNQRIVAKSTSTLSDATVTVTFQAIEGGKTLVTCIEEYTIHGGILGKLGEAFLNNYIDHAAELTQATLKARIEAKVPAMTR